MPGVVLVGTTPILYKIPVTADLVRHIAHGTYPPEATIVLANVPVLPRPRLRYSEGMKPLDNRQAMLRCYESFIVMCKAGLQALKPRLPGPQKPGQAGPATGLSGLEGSA